MVCAIIPGNMDSSPIEWSSVVYRPAIIFVWTPTENDEYWKSCFPFVWGKESDCSFSFFFSYKTIERGYEPERSKKLLDEVQRIMNESGNSTEKIFSTDGTGLNSLCILTIHNEIVYSGFQTSKRNRYKYAQ